MLTAITLEPGTMDLFETRHMIGDALSAAMVPEFETERVVLALSELATNAIQHGPGTPIRIEVHSEGSQIELRVRQQAGSRTIPDPDFWRLPQDQSQVGGRGLAIVAAVSDAVEVRADDETVEIRARFFRCSEGAPRS